MSVKDSGWGVIQPPNSPLQFLGNDAIEKLIKDFKFITILDVGSSSGAHSEYFKAHGKAPTTLDIAISEKNVPDIVGSFESVTFSSRFDAIWISHVVEHILNLQSFLVKIHDVVKQDGIIAITVPPLKHNIVSGHVNLFNQGLLLYRLVCAGIDCSECSIKTYGYNISVIVKKKETDLRPFDFPPSLNSIQKYLPYPIPTEYDGRRPLQINW